MLEFRKWHSAQARKPVVPVAYVSLPRIPSLEVTLMDSCVEGQKNPVFKSHLKFSVIFFLLINGYN